MKKVLLSLSVVSLLSLPALAQGGPGAAPGTQDKPASQQPSKGGPGMASALEVEPSPGAEAPAAGAKVIRPRVYDEAADAKADIAAAVAKARAEKKRVLVTLGANWCNWCRSLDATFVTDGKVSAAIAKSYVPVKVDVGRMTKNLDLAATWGADPKKGIPLLVVLDADGKAVTVKDTESLESGKKHDPAKVLVFLSENARK